MRTFSLRTRVLALAVFFAAVLVGIVSVTTYFVIGNAMLDVAESHTLDISRRATEALAARATDARLRAASMGYAGEEADEEALRILYAELPDILRGGGGGDGEYALYDSGLDLIWFSDEVALNDHRQHRELALQQRRTVDLNRLTQKPLTGLFGEAVLGTYYVHVPVDLPAEGTAVLDVAYPPVTEEATIDRIRPFMAILAVVAMGAAVLMMQLSTGWVLRLVDDLRRAAESIDAGDLDELLPEDQRNEIGELARSINRLVEQLRRRAQAQTRFVADASHELATPVAGIRGYVNILRAWGAEDPAVRKESIDAIDRESSRMARLCSDLLSLIREERFTAPQVTRVDVNALLREQLADAASRYIDKGQEFQGPDEGPIIVDTDRDRLAQLFAILVDNAAKYTPPGGRVSGTTRRRGDDVFIEIEDTGIGIPPEHLEHVFDRFYRSDRSRSQETGGFGLGLSIAKQIVDSAGGEIGVESAVGEGTRFTIRLPGRHLTSR